MDQPRLDNKTDFDVHPQRLLDRDGDALVALVKATFELQAGGALELAPSNRARPIRLADIPWEEKKPESVAYPADICLRKPATDVIFVAKACAPAGKAVPSFEVRVEVGSLETSLVVFGRRLWVENGSALTPPAPIDEIDLRHDHAWGGKDDGDPATFLEEARNPVGTGAARDLASLTHKPAPHVEDPTCLIKNARTAPPPAGIGPIGRRWAPRRHRPRARPARQRRLCVSGLGPDHRAAQRARTARAGGAPRGVDAHGPHLRDVPALRAPGRHHPHATVVL